MLHAHQYIGLNKRKISSHRQKNEQSRFTKTCTIPVISWIIRAPLTKLIIFCHRSQQLLYKERKNIKRE